MSRRLVGSTIAAAGAVFALVVAFGDQIGIATHVSGWKLALGVGLGALFVVVGLLVARVSGR